MVDISDPDYEAKIEKLLEVVHRGDIGWKLMAHSATVGFSEGLLEVVTRGIGIKMFKNLAGAGKEVVQKSLKQWGLEIARAFGEEGLSEVATLALTLASEQHILGDKEAFLGDTK